MHLLFRTPAIAACLVLSPPYLQAQTAVEPSGHWEGTIKAPDRAVNIEIDLAKSATGGYRGTFTGTDVKGLPVSDVVVDGTSVRFRLEVNNGGAFKGTVATDGKSIAGDFTTGEGGITLPFSMTRTGEARIEDPKSGAIGKQFEGTWNGTIEVNGTPMRVTVSLSNHPDGTCTGTVANLDQGGLEIPITTITQKASAVTLDVKIVNGVYAGTLNADGTELAGTWTQGPFEAPLTFRRAR